METTIKEQILSFGRLWVRAEETGDTATLDDITVSDFTLVGPHGFVLDKDQWLDRYRNDDLHTDRLRWSQITVRTYANIAVATGTIAQEATYHGHSAGGDFRATLILMRTQSTWLLVGMHLSPIMSAQPSESGNSTNGAASR